jgi:hypothetical protein
MKGGPKARKIVRKVNLDASDKLLFDVMKISTARSKKTRLIQRILKEQLHVCRSFNVTITYQNILSDEHGKLSKLGAPITVI